VNNVFEIPVEFAHVCYNPQKIPKPEHEANPDFVDLVLGANCQLYAYELLRYFGRKPPSLRSSELWDDQCFTKAVASTYQIFDLMLYNKTPQAYGAHVGVYVGDDRVLHLSYAIGYPVIQSHTELLSQEKYAYFIGAKRVLG